MEECDLLYIKKDVSEKVIKRGMSDSKFKERLDFIKRIPLFQKINVVHLQPLITNLIAKKYRRGDYI